MAPSVGTGRMIFSEAQFVRSILDLGSIPTKQDQRATVNYVWDATHTVIRSATCRRNRQLSEFEGTGMTHESAMDTYHADPMPTDVVLYRVCLTLLHRAA